MPVSTRKVERWICDRCGFKAEFPDGEGHTALESGWLQFDLGRSLRMPERGLQERNVQVVCLRCSYDLAVWFQDSRPTNEEVVDRLKNPFV